MINNACNESVGDEEQLLERQGRRTLYRHQSWSKAKVHTAGTLPCLQTITRSTKVERTRDLDTCSADNWHYINGQDAELLDSLMGQIIGRAR
jgi:hypothetical protein